MREPTSAIVSKTIAVRLPLVALILALLMAPGCPGPGPVPVITTAVIDCASENQASINSVYTELVGELQSTLTVGGKFDWAIATQKAKTSGIRIGGCVLAKLVQWYLGGRQGAGGEESWKARGAFEEYRDKELGGATVKVEIDGKVVEL